MSTKQIVIFPRGQLSAKDKERATKLGVFIMEADDPSKVVTIIPCAPISGDTLLACAVEAMSGTGSSSERQKFGEAVMRQIAAREARHV